MNTGLMTTKKFIDYLAPKKLCVVYIAGPYRAENAWQIHQNVLRAEAAIPELIRRGYAPICVHKMTENLQGLFSDQTYLDIGLELVRRSDAICLLKGWRQSKGSVEEYELAKELGLETVFESQDEMP